MADEGTFGHGGGNNPDAWGGSPRGPYGTNEGDIWLGTGSAVQQQLDAEGKGLIMIHEVMKMDGKMQERVYITDNAEIIAEATRGHQHYIAQQAANN